eukprot:Gb_22190 [translate_table: standard]
MDKPKVVQFELKDKDFTFEYESKEEDELTEEEPQTLILRRLVQERRHPKRYRPHKFYSTFVLSTTDDDPRTIMEALNSIEDKF